MAKNRQTHEAADRVLVKPRPSGAQRAAESRANLRPPVEPRASAF